jgi:two-component system heavy metal sensor histidine kinase CusS
VRRPLSLALRLTLLFGIASSIVFPVFGWVIFQSTENHFREQDNDELKDIAIAVQGALSERRAPQDITLLKRRFDDILVGHHKALLYAAEPDGQVLYASPDLDLSAVLARQPDGPDADAVRDWNNQNRSYRLFTGFEHENTESTIGPVRYVVAVPIDDHVLFLASFRSSLLLLILSSIALMSLMGWVAVRQGHAPLHDIVERIRRIRMNELAIRLSPDAVPSELTELAVSFNEMLERVDETFHRLSDFNADIAHELRTPITNLMTQTEVGLSRARTAGEYREILYSNMEEYERMAKMVGDMLFLAQSDSRSNDQNFAEFEVAHEVRTLFDYYEGWAEDRGVTLAFTGSSQVIGDRLMLRRALSNLLSNAIYHTSAGGTVRVDLDASKKGETRISIVNPGSPIPPEHIPRLFDRFYRIDPSRQKNEQGVGLGLAIVKSIVNAHNGSIDVTSASGYTTFKISLPDPQGTPRL